jgi:hypothetical protein
VIGALSLACRPGVALPPYASWTSTGTAPSDLVVANGVSNVTRERFPSARWWNRGDGTPRRGTPRRARPDGVRYTFYSFPRRSTRRTASDAPHRRRAKDPSMALDPEDLRRYAARDWGAPERMSRVARAAMPTAAKLAIAVALYEAMRSSVPRWPDDDTRRADLAAHVRLRGLLERARHVGVR